MKKRIIIFGILLQAFIFADVLINLEIDENALITREKVSTFNSLTADFGYMSHIKSNLALLFYYQLAYSGSGIGDIGEINFTDRYQDHFLVIKSIWQLNKKFIFKSSVNALLEYYKFAKNEKWGKGLYDFYNLGGSISIDYNLFNKAPLVYSLSYNDYTLPNNYSLKNLYLTASSDIPDENYSTFRNIFAVNNLPVIKPFFLTVRYIYNHSIYDNKKVLKANGYYKNTFQTINDSIINIIPQIGKNNKILSVLFYYQDYKSNQNFISGYNIFNIYFFDNYYSYNLIKISPQFQFPLLHNIFTINTMLAKKKYAHRPIQKKDGSFGGSSLFIDNLYCGFDYNIKVNKYTKISPVYNYIVSRSNSDIPGAVLYNFSAHVVTFKINYSY